MFSCTMKSFIHCLFIIYILSSVNGQDRKIIGELNPGCLTCSVNDTLVYIKAQGTHDTIHQIWDFTIDTPTVILVVAGTNSSMNVTWEDTYPIKFTLSEKPKYSFATVIDKLYEYDDLQDNGYIDAKSPQRLVPFSRVSWTRQKMVRTEQEVMLQIRGQFNKKTAGIIDLKLDLLPFKDYAVDLPHLIHTANSTLIDVSLVNLTMSPEYNASRFALQLLMVSVDQSNDTMRYTMRKSLDDEHTPGVFEIVEIRSPGSALRGEGGFLQFRPVAYTEAARGVASSTYVHVSTFNKTRIPEKSTLRTFYNDFDWSSLLVQDMFVSFGEAGDGFYKHSNYTSWSLTVGYGAPPREGFSTFVVAIIASGLGVPVALATSGALYAIVRRRRQRNAPVRFTDEQ